MIGLVKTAVITTSTRLASSKICCMRDFFVAKNRRISFIEDTLSTVPTEKLAGSRRRARRPGRSKAKNRKGHQEEDTGCCGRRLHFEYMKQWRRALIQQHRGKLFDDVLTHCDSSRTDNMLPFFHGAYSAQKMGMNLDEVHEARLERACLRRLGLYMPY